MSRLNFRLLTLNSKKNSTLCFYFAFLIGMELIRGVLGFGFKEVSGLSAIYLSCGNAFLSDHAVR
jgi:hypothetical protein